VVLDRVGNEDESLAQQLSATVPIALIDPLAMQSLSRLGEGSPLTGAQTYELSKLKDQEKPSIMATMAREKLGAARILMEQQLTSSAMELLLSSLLAASADRANLTTPPAPAEAAVWLYSEAVPLKVLSQDEAALILQVMGLTQAQEIPDPLLLHLLADIAAFIN